MYWNRTEGLLQSQAMSKMMSYHNTIKETKLINFPGLNMMKFDHTLVLTLDAASHTHPLQLNMGPVVLRNHTGPKDIGFTLLVMSFL